MLRGPAVALRPSPTTVRPFAAGLFGIALDADGGSARVEPLPPRVRDLPAICLCP